jgi:hypothetical protein
MQFNPGNNPVPGSPFFHMASEVMRAGNSTQTAPPSRRNTLHLFHDQARHAVRYSGQGTGFRCLETPLTILADYHLQGRPGVVLHQDGSYSNQAAVAWEAGKDLTIEDIQVEPPRAHEVRIEIYYTGVCHTGTFGWPSAPRLTFQMPTRCPEKTPRAPSP